MALEWVRTSSAIRELVEDLAPLMEPDDVERSVAARFPWLDDERLAAAWLTAYVVRNRALRKR